MFLRIGMFARLVSLVAIMVCFAVEAQSQMAATPGGGIPPRPPIFLNNNASLYTFPNPNFGKPSQLPFAFVAVAHEDCRLFNNGAMLMPKHRLMAAECLNTAGMNGTGTGGINPLTGLPNGTGVPGTGGLPGGAIQGINFARPPVYNPWLAAAYRNYYGNQQNNGYYNYPMQADAVLTTQSSDSDNASGTSTSAKKTYRGFGSFSEARLGGFPSMLQIGSTSFGRGFETESTDDSTTRKKKEADKD
jgi:hypothetical protein